MSAASATVSVRLLPDDLLECLRPTVLLPAIAASIVFGLACLYAPPVGKAMAVAVMVAGLAIVLISPTWGFVVSVFLFAFRNAFFPLGPLHLADAVFALTTVSWVCHAMIRGRLVWHGVLVPLLFYISTEFLSGIGAEYRSVFLADLVRQMYVVVILLVGMQLLTTRRAVLLATRAFLAAGLVMVVCALLGAVDRLVLHHAAYPFADTGGRFGIQSIAVDPLRIASFLLFPMLAMAGLQQRATTRPQRLTAGALFWAGVMACALSASRSAVLQLIPGLLVLWWLTGWHRSKLLVIGGGTLLLVLVVSYMPLRGLSGMAPGMSRWALAGQLAEGRTEPRKMIWAAAQRAFLSSPLTGVGLENFKSRYLEFRDPWTTRGWIYYHNKAVHSVYLAQLAETGILGTLTFAVLLVYMLIVGYRGLVHARHERDEGRYLLMVAAYGALVGQVVAGVALELFAHNHVWVLMTLLVVLDRPHAIAPATDPVGLAPARVES